MENRMNTEMALSEYQIQAARRNKLEYHRLERNIHLMHDDLQQRLIRLTRQAQYLRCHYTNVVKVVKPNRRYQLWKQAHALDIKQVERQDRLETIKFRQKSESKTQQELLSSDSVRPLLLLHDDNVQKPTESILDFTESILRPKTSSISRHRVYPLATFITQTNNSTNHIRSQSSHSRAVSFLPLMVSPESLAKRRINQAKRPRSERANY